MTEEIFLEKMMDILDVEDDLTMDTRLDSIEGLDSLSIISFIAMANAYCSKSIKSEDIKTTVIIRDLYNLL